NALYFVLRDTGADRVRLVEAIWNLLLCFGFWLMHFHYAAGDRAAGGERGASATLRRWYTYGVELVSLVVLLFACQELLTTTGLRRVSDAPISTGHVATVVARALVMLGIWVYHAHWVRTAAVLEDDRGSTLRAVAGFGILGLSVAMTLSETSRALYYGLAR